MPNRADRILGEWSAVARTAHAPMAPRPTSATAAGGVSLVGLGLLAVALVVAVAWLGNRDGLSGVGAVPSPTPSATISPATPAPTAIETPAPTASATPRAPSPTPAPSLLAACAASDLAVQITMWEGAAGSRIAHLELTNTGPGTCSTPDTWQPSLVDGDGNVLIAGKPSSADSRITLPAQQTVTALALASNYCGQAPVPPVSIAFAFDDAQVTAAPESADDATVPPCNGS